MRKKKIRLKKKESLKVIMINILTRKTLKSKTMKGKKRTKKKLTSESKKERPRTTSLAMKVLMKRLERETWVLVTLKKSRKKVKEVREKIDLLELTEDHIEEEANIIEVALAITTKKDKAEEAIMFQEVVREEVAISQEEAILEEKEEKTIKVKNLIEEEETTTTSIKVKEAEEVTRDKENSLRKISPTWEMMDLK
jgi:hypothetical protein